MRVSVPYLVSLLLAVPLIVPAAPVDYVREVKPVLAQHCYKCHASRDQKSGLRLDTVALALKGGEHGPAIRPGRSSDSLLVQALRGTAAELKQMPLRAEPLNNSQIDLIARWIDEGARAPADEKPEDPLAAGRSHWAFQTPQRPPVPPVRNPQSAIRNPVDAFIQARLEPEGIHPSPEADRYTLIRRLSLDLTGLLPTIGEVDAFVQDRSPDAYERLMGRLLDSPHYGERWGRWWLDLARYADSNGYSIDAPREIWLYRDWVINAFNRDLPFDQFAIQQLAGDLLPADPKVKVSEAVIATGFHRNTQINQEGGIDKEQFRIEAVVDRLATTGTAFLGLTIACAQCHDHKFDPISQREYYELFAFFNNQDEPTVTLPNPRLNQAALDREQADLTADLKARLAEAADRVAELEEKLSDAANAKLSKAVRDVLKVEAAKRSFKQQRIVHLALAGNDQEFKAADARLAELESGKARNITTMVLAELKEPRDTFIHIKGDFTRPGDKVIPATPAILHDFKSAIRDPQSAIPNRLDFAHWLVSPQNPLLARVTVNRIWQQYFGVGLVETENDFGTQGLPPTHPELLDWLACELMEPTSGITETAVPRWSLKHMHRLIVTSATYRQSSKARPDLSLKDANNKLLARQNRLRLDAEIVRDVALSASGSLAGKIGGPSVFPPQPDGVMSLGQVKRTWKPDQDEDRFRRGMYTFLYRATPHPALSVFDAPDAFSACSRRPRSNTPLQALTLLNDQAFHEFAQRLAQRIVAEGPADDSGRIAHGFRLCLARPPSAEESTTLLRLLKQERAEARKSSDTNAWAMVARVLLNLDETITRE